MSSPLPPEKTVAAPASGSLLREAGLTAAAAGVVVLFAASLLLLDPRFFWIDDAQSGATPGYCEIARAWRSGELPLLSRSNWRSSALACEFPTGVFSPTLELSILLVFNLGLPLALASAGLSLIHLAVLAAGAFRLARRGGLSADLAMLAALVASINGWIIIWGARNWGVCLYSFAWLPWFWWALERARAGRGGWLAFAPAAVFLFLIITAGWPVTVAMAALVTLWVMLRTWADRRSLRALWPAPVAWVVGVLLAAPMWLMVLEFMPYADRVRNAPLFMTSMSWVTPLDALPGLILPNVVAQWFVFGTPRAHASAELAGGLVPVVILAACLWYGGRSALRALRWEWAFCGLVLVLALCPSPGQITHSFRWLPLFFLALGLAAAHGLAWARARSDGRKLPNLGRIALVLVLCVWVREMLTLPWIETHLVTSGAVVALVALLWSFLDGRLAPASFARAWAPCGVALLSCWIAYAACRTVTDVPVWGFGEEMRQAGPLDPNVRYLSVHTEADVFDFEEWRVNERWRGIGDELRFGNTAAYAGLDFVNGYSPMKPLGLQEVFHWEVHGFFQEPADARRVLACETGPDGLLRRMGVDGLVVSDPFLDSAPLLQANGWEETARVKGGRVFQRTGPPSARVYAVQQAEVVKDRGAAVQQLLTHGTAPAPSLLLTGPRSAAEGELHLAPAEATVVDDRRNSMIVDVKSAPGEGEVLVVFARPWFPGYHAVCDGKPVPVEVFDLFLPAVRLPAGTNGRVVLEYWPTSLTIGLWIAGATAALLALAVAAEGCRRRLRRRAVVAFSADAVTPIPVDSVGLAATRQGSAVPTRSPVGSRLNEEAKR